MKKTEYPICENCENPILKPENGFIVLGNIYSAKINGGGFIGRSLPEPDKDGNINIKNLNEIALCNACFFKALGFESFKEASGQIWMSRQKIDLGK